MSERMREVIHLPLAMGGHLMGDFAYTGQPQSFAVLCVHGFGSHRGGEKVLAMEVECARRGWTWASFDFRGHGQSSGTLLDLRGSGLLADLEAIQLYLRGRGVERLFLFGSSMGGWASSWFARRHPSVTPALVLLAPAFYFLQSRWSRLTPAQQEAYRSTGRIRYKSDWVDADIGYGLVAERDDYPPEQLFDEWQTPTLIYHGMRDDVVRPDSSLQFIRSTPYPQVELRLLRDGDHRLTMFKNELAEQACQFFTRFL